MPKKNKCRIASCRKAAKPGFVLCYEHRLYEPDSYLTAKEPNPLLSKYFCDKCGQTFWDSGKRSCRYCGGSIEEVGG